MVYHMPVMNKLLQDMDNCIWYCSLDMTNGFWVVEMVDQARLISAPGLLEWLLMPFGLINAPQICQHLVNFPLYGYLKIQLKFDKITTRFDEI